MQSHRGTDRQGQTGGSGAELRAGGALKLQNLGSLLFFPIPHLQTHHILTHRVGREGEKTSFSYLIFGKPPGDRNLVLRTRPSLLCWEQIHTHTHSLTLTQTHSPTTLHHGGSGCSSSKQIPETSTENPVWISEKTQRGEGKQRGGLLAFHQSNCSEGKERLLFIVHGIPSGSHVFLKKNSNSGGWRNL